MTNLNILLESGHQGRLVFFPGNFINGVVELSLDSVKKFRGCYILIYGYARAHWTETRTRSTGSGKNRRTTTHTVHFEGKQIFLNSKTYLFGRDGGESKEMHPGMHRYNFSCQLPELVPYSMDAAHGNIGYYCEAVLDIPWRFDKETKVPFTVTRVDDMNHYPELRLAHRMEEVKTFCCLFCESGPLLMEVRIPRSGFAGGEKIPVQIKYANRSDVKVMSTLIKIKRIFHFTSYTPSTKTRSNRESVVEISTNGVNENASVDLQANIEIPRILMNSNGRFCHVVQVEYSLKVEGVVGDCHSNPEIEFPITIGSIGIQEIRVIPAPSAPEPTHLPSAPAQSIDEKDDLPPPFEEAILMAKPETSFATNDSTNGVGWNVKPPQ